jgi:uncharacterized protein YbjT (DUF2867 family)
MTEAIATRRLLVTGGTGTLGREVVATLLGRPGASYGFRVGVNA